MTVESTAQGQVLYGLQLASFDVLFMASQYFQKDFMNNTVYKVFLFREAHELYSNVNRQQSISPNE